MLLRRALPATRQKTARPFPVYEMGSRNVAGLLLIKLLIDNDVTGVTGV
jgi:hypothetical protein